MVITSRNSKGKHFNHNDKQTEYFQDAINNHNANEKNKDTGKVQSRTYGVIFCIRKKQITQKCRIKKLGSEKRKNKKKIPDHLSNW